MSLIVVSSASGTSNFRVLHVEVWVGVVASTKNSKLFHTHNTQSTKVSPFRIILEVIQIYMRHEKNKMEYYSI